MARYIVTIDGCSAEQADQVIAERIAYDEDYGFTYTIGYERAPANKHCPCGGTVRFEESINFLVCKDCCEILYVNELVV